MSTLITVATITLCIFSLFLVFKIIRTGLVMMLAFFIGRAMQKGLIEVTEEGKKQGLHR